MEAESTMSGLVQRDGGDRQISNTASAVRFVLAILVVLIHVCLPRGETVTNYFEFGFWFCLMKLVVPLFFVLSAFFHYKKTAIDHFDLQAEKRYLAKLARLYCTWAVIYLPIMLWDIRGNGKGLAYNCLAIAKNFFFSGSCLHLWYLHATIISVVLISVLLYFRASPKKIIIIALAFCFAGLFASSWFGFIRPLEGTPVWDFLRLVKRIIASSRNGLFIGFVFTGIGMLYALYSIPITEKQARFGFLLSLLLMFVEAFTLKRLDFIRESEIYFFLVPAVFFLFAWIRYIKVPDSGIYRDLRMLSAIIYYIHWWVWRVVYKMLTLIGGPLTATWVVFLVTLAATVLLSMAILKLSGKPGFKWMKKLYS